MVCCMSLPMWASYQMVPSEDLAEYSSDDLYRMTFDLVADAVKNNIKLSNYNATFAFASTKAPVVKFVDQFFEEYAPLSAKEKTDIISLSIAYLGCLFFSSWGIWSISKYNIAFADLWGFLIWVTTLGG